MANLPSAHIGRQIEEARKCLITQALSQVCCAVPPAGTAGATITHVGHIQRRIQCMQTSSVQQQQPPSRIESRRILNKMNEANAVFDPANSGYRRPPVADPCPYPDTRYVHVGEAEIYDPFKCYDRVVGFN